VQPADNAVDDMDEEEAVGSLHSLSRRSLGVVAGPEPPIVEPAAPSRCPSGDCICCVHVVLTAFGAHHSELGVPI
jgi:hypothetical protein